MSTTQTCHEQPAPMPSAGMVDAKLLRHLRQGWRAEPCATGTPPPMRQPEMLRST